MAENFVGDESRSQRFAWRHATSLHNVMPLHASPKENLFTTRVHDTHSLQTDRTLDDMLWMPHEDWVAGEYTARLVGTEQELRPKPRLRLPLRDVSTTLRVMLGMPCHVLV